MAGNYHDLLIVGGGMAGLTAAIYGTRAGLSVIVLEKEICGGLANWTHVVENFPTHKSIGGMDLMEKVKNQAESCGVTIEEVNKVTGFMLAGRPKKVISDDETHQAGAVILAMGRVPRKLALEDEWEEHVHYCSLCDGSLYKGKRVIVVGGGNSGFDESLYLLGLGVEQITIVEAMQSCIADQATQQKLLATGKVDIHTNTVISAIEPDATGAQITLSDQSTKMDQQINAHGIFVFIGQIPQTECLKGLVELDQQGYIIANGDMHTSLPGIFAAGDVINKKYRQLTTAAADGTIAALEAERYLRGLATSLA